MRKLAVLIAALVAVFAMATVAFAQSTSYDVTASTSPAKAGSPRQPVPVSIKFSIKAQGTGRPSSSEQFRVAFAGIRFNNAAFKTCSVTRMNRDKSDRSCSRASRMGSGVVNNLAGASADPNDTSVPCNLKVTIYNSGRNLVGLWLVGGPTISGANCPISINQALPARIVKSGGGQGLQFSIPSNLRHPIGGLDNGISQISATISKKTTRVRGRTVGFTQAVGCRGGSRAVTLTLTAENGSTSVSRGAARC